MANTTTTKTVVWPTGVNVLHAGTPLDTNGRIANDSNAVGILAADLYAPDRTATVVTAGTWDESVNAPYFRIPDAVKNALYDIAFTPPPKLTDDEIIAAVQAATQPATTEAYGTVKQAEAVADAESAPTQAEFNGLLAALRASGAIYEAADDEEEESPK